MIVRPSATSRRRSASLKAPVVSFEAVGLKISAAHSPQPMVRRFFFRARAISLTAAGEKNHVHARSPHRAVNLAHRLDRRCLALLHPRLPRRRHITKILHANERPVRQQRLIQIEHHGEPLAGSAPRHALLDPAARRRRQRGEVASVLTGVHVGANFLLERINIRGRAGTRGTARGGQQHQESKHHGPNEHARTMTARPTVRN